MVAGFEFSWSPNVEYRYWTSDKTILPKSGYLVSKDSVDSSVLATSVPDAVSTTPFVSQISGEVVPIKSGVDLGNVKYAHKPTAVYWIEVPILKELFGQHIGFQVSWETFARSTTLYEIENKPLVDGPWSKWQLSVDLSEIADSTYDVLSLPIATNPHYRRYVVMGRMFVKKAFPKGSRIILRVYHCMDFDWEHDPLRVWSSVTAQFDVFNRIWRSEPSRRRESPDNSFEWVAPL